MITFLKKIIVVLLTASLFLLTIIGPVEAQGTRPVASNVSIDSGAASVTLTEGSTKNVVCIAVVTDDDGCEDIVTTTAVFYRTSVTGGAGAADDNNNHYSINCVVDSGSCTGGGDLTATYTCTFPVYYYADPTDAGDYEATDWTCQVAPSDGVGEGTANTDTIEMASLAGLDVESTINYGELALGTDTESVNQQTIITNKGNVQIDIKLDGYGSEDGDGKSMICSIGSIPIGNEEYSTSAFTYGTGTNLTDTAVEIDLDVPQQTDDANPSTKEVYWGFGMPSAGVGGSCSGTVVFTAVNDIGKD